MEQCVAQNLTPQERQQVKAFYLWGGPELPGHGPGGQVDDGVFRKMLAAQEEPQPRG